jgi:hypothetical protein
MKNSFKLLILALFVALSFTSCHKKDGKIDPNDTKTDIVVFNAEGKSIGDLIAAYKKEFSDEACDSSRLAKILTKFKQIIASNDRFTGKAPSHIQPIYAYGIDGVAYYEVWFTGDQKTLQGWVLISATDKDYPIVNYSNGIPYSSRIVKGEKDEKAYRFGVSYYALEKNGKKVAEYGEFPKYVSNTSIEKSGECKGDSKDSTVSKNNSNDNAVAGVDYFVVSDYESLKSLYSKYYFTDKKKEVAKKMESEIFATNANRSGRTDAAYIYRYISGNFGFYTQIAPNSGWNPYSCYAGCNNNAWASIFAWWDLNMSKGALIPTTSTGETCPLYRNTTARRNSVDPVQMYCRSVCGTFCDGTGGATYFSKAYLAYKYPSSKGYGYWYNSWWCNSAGCNVNMANILTDGLANNYRPVQIGGNSHFYVGYGYAQWDTNTDWTWAYCYPGWSENHNDDVWVSWHDFNSATELFVY